MDISGSCEQQYGPKWDQFDLSNQGIIQLDTPQCNMTYLFDNKTCAFFDNVLQFNWLGKYQPL